VESAPPKTVESVRAALENLHHLMAAARLYGRYHPKTEKAAERMAGQIAALFRDAGELEFRVRRNGLLWMDAEIYADDDSRDGIARTLHREGITSFALLPGLNRDELVTFAELIGINLNLPMWEEETLSSLLWQLQLKHIVYEAVEHLSDAQELSETTARGEEGYIHEMVRQILDPDPPAPGEGAGTAGAVPVQGATGDGPGVPPAGIGSDRGAAGGAQGVSPAGVAPGAAPGATGQGAAGRGPDVPQDHRDISRSLPPGDRSAAEAARSDVATPGATWTPAQHIAAMDLGKWAEGGDDELEEEVDLQALRREAAEDDAPNLLTRTVSLLLIAAARGRAELTSGEGLALVDRALQREEAVEVHLWKSAVSLALRISASDAPLLQPGKDDIEEWLDQCTRPAMFTAFASTLSPKESSDVQLLRRFLTGRDRQRARLVVQRMGQADRRLEWVMDQVAAVVRQDVAELTHGLDRRPVEEILQVIDLLRRMGDEQANTLVQRLLEHRMPDVRAAAVRALPDPLPRTLLEPVLARLADDSPAVRDAVVELLRTRRPVGAFDTLREMFEGASFAEGGGPQKRVIATALAAAGADAAIPLLQERLLAHGFFAGAEARREMEACAAALGAIDSLKARVALKQGAKSLQPTLRRICREALQSEGR